MLVNSDQVRQSAAMVNEAPPVTSAFRPDGNYSIALEEGRHALDLQRDDFKSVRDRSIAILGIASISASIVGGFGTADHKSVSGWLFGAGGCLGLVILLSLGIAWPRKVTFTQNVNTVVGWSDNGEDVTEPVIQRQLAIYLQEQYDGNEKKLGWMFICFQFEIALLIGQLALLGIDLWR